MKVFQTVLGFVMGFGLLVQTIQAEELKANKNSKDAYKISLGINPVPLIFPWVELHLGVTLNEHFRLNFNPGYYSWLYNDVNLDAHAIGGSMSMSFFFDPWKGWYIEPGVLFLHATDDDSTDTARILGFQTIAGYEEAWESGLFVNLGLGVGLAKGFTNDDYINDATFPYPTGNIYIGKRF